MDIRKMSRVFLAAGREAVALAEILGTTVLFGRKMPRETEAKIDHFMGDIASGQFDGLSDTEFEHARRERLGDNA